MDGVVISVDPITRKAKITGDRIYIGDSTVSVVFDGIDTDCIETLCPCIRFISLSNIICAEAMLSRVGDTVTCVINTNTEQFLKQFRGLPHMARRQFIVRIFSTTESEPIAIGTTSVYNFPISNGTEVSNIPSTSVAFDGIYERFSNIENSLSSLGGEISSERTSRVINDSSILTTLDNTKSVIDSHISRIDNPHQVTKAQLALGNVDNTCDLDKPVSYPQQQALNELSANIAIVDSELESTREELEDEILGKADVNHTHSQYALASNVANNISALSNAIQGKADVLHTHSGYAATNHTHSDLATKYELNTELAKKANVNHTHNYSPIGHGHADYVKQSDIAEFIAASNPQPLKDRNFSLATVRDISSALAEVIRALGGNVL